MFNFKEEDYFKEFTDEYTEYNSMFKVLTDYQRKNILTKINELTKDILSDLDTFEIKSISISKAFSESLDWLRWGGSSALKEVLIYRGVLMNLKEYKKLNFKLDNPEKYTECPLEVRLQVVHNTPVYDAEGNEYLVEYVEKEGFTVYNIFYMSFRWSDYKVTWFLKKDKSE